MSGLLPRISSSSKTFESVEATITCPSCLEVMTEPVFVCENQHTYDLHCIKEWAKDKKTCPECREKLQEPFKTNRTALNYIEGYRKDLKKVEQEKANLEQHAQLLLPETQMSPFIGLTINPQSVGIEPSAPPLTPRELENIESSNLQARHDQSSSLAGHKNDPPEENLQPIFISNILSSPSSTVDDATHSVPLSTSEQEALDNQDKVLKSFTESMRALTEKLKKKSTALASLSLLRDRSMLDRAKALAGPEIVEKVMAERAERNALKNVKSKSGTSQGLQLPNTPTNKDLSNDEKNLK